MNAGGSKNDYGFGQKSAKQKSRTTNGNKNRSITNHFPTVDEIPEDEMRGGQLNQEELQSHFENHVQGKIAHGYAFVKDDQ